MVILFPVHGNTWKIPHNGREVEGTILDVNKEIWTCKLQMC